MQGDGRAYPDGDLGRRNGDLGSCTRPGRDDRRVRVQGRAWPRSTRRFGSFRASVRQGVSDGPIGQDVSVVRGRTARVSNGDEVTTRAGVFDVGGILVELSGVSVFQCWIGNRLTPQEAWCRWLTSPAVRAFETRRIRPDVFADALIDEFDLPLGPEEFLSAFERWPRRILVGAAELVRRVDDCCVRALNFAIRSLASRA